MSPTKICTWCHKEQPLESFHKAKGYRGGRRTWCKNCCHEKNKVKKATAEYKAQQRDYSRRTRENFAEREKRRLRMKTWRANNVERVRAANIARYGLTFEAFNELLVAQHGCCKICGLKLVPMGGPQKNEKAHIDHCHATGTVRGLLCGQCNIMLGAAKDRVEVLLAAAEYLYVNQTGPELPAG